MSPNYSSSSKFYPLCLASTIETKPWRCCTCTVVPRGDGLDVPRRGVQRLARLQNRRLLADPWHGHRPLPFSPVKRVHRRGSRLGRRVLPGRPRRQRERRTRLGVRHASERHDGKPGGQGQGRRRRPRTHRLGPGRPAAQPAGDQEGVAALLPLRVPGRLRGLRQVHVQVQGGGGLVGARPRRLHASPCAAWCTWSA